MAAQVVEKAMGANVIKHAPTDELLQGQVETDIQGMEMLANRVAGHINST